MIHSLFSWFARLLALVLVWNVLAGLTVAILAPLLMDAQPMMTGERFGWFAPELPTHFAGFWLAAIGGAGLMMFRSQNSGPRHRRWNLAALAFYLPQTAAVFGPITVCWWVGMYAPVLLESGLPAGSLPGERGPMVVFLNLAPIALTLLHVQQLFGLRIDVRKVARHIGPAIASVFARSPGSALGIAGRFAFYAALMAVPLVPLVPASYFSDHSRLLLIPIVAFNAFWLAYAWSRAQREPSNPRDGATPRFGWVRGLICSVLAYLISALMISVLGYFFSAESFPFFRLAVIGAIFMPQVWLVPLVGILAGAYLKTGLKPGKSGRSIGLGAWASLALPAIALAIPALIVSPDEQMVRESRALTARIESLFDASRPEGIYDLLTEESKRQVPREGFLSRLREIRSSVGAVESRKWLRYRIYLQSRLFEITTKRTGRQHATLEQLVFDLSTGAPRLQALGISIENAPPTAHFYAATRPCHGEAQLLHCASLNEPLPKRLFW